MSTPNSRQITRRAAMSTNDWKMWTCRAGFGMIAWLLGIGLYRAFEELAPRLLSPFMASGNAQIEMLEALWTCLG